MRRRIDAITGVRSMMFVQLLAAQVEEAVLQAHVSGYSARQIPAAAVPRPPRHRTP
jgi:hypothetical protein